MLRLSNQDTQLTFIQAGGLAGTAVDLLFFPIDTIKTRLQSAQGFARAGGFKGVYNGLGSVVVGSAPGGTCILSLTQLHLPENYTSRCLLLNIRNNEEAFASTREPCTCQPHDIGVRGRSRTAVPLLWRFAIPCSRSTWINSRLRA